MGKASLSYNLNSRSHANLGAAQFLRIVGHRAGGAGLNELVYRTIKTAIVTCEILPGSELSEGVLAQRYQVGKAPIRNALSKLGQERWVRSVPRKGHVVPNVSIEDAEEIFAMRELLEPDIARRAAGRIDPGHLRKLHAACAIAVQKTDAQATRRLLSAHQRFHVELAYAAGNTRIAQTVEQLHHECFRLLFLIIRSEGYSPKWDYGQQKLVDALIAGESEKAAKITLQGIRLKRRGICQLLSRNSTLLLKNAPTKEGLTKKESGK